MGIPKEKNPGLSGGFALFRAADDQLGRNDSRRAAIRPRIRTRTADRALRGRAMGAEGAGTLDFIRLNSASYRTLT